MSPIMSETDFLDEDWKWYAGYLHWEDNNTDELLGLDLNQDNIGGFFL